MTTATIKGKYVGRCRVTNKMLKYPDDSWIRFTSELLCKCHDQWVIKGQMVDKIAERKDGWYWIGAGP